MVLGFFFNLPLMNFSFIARRIADLIHNSWICHHALIAYWWEMTGGWEIKDIKYQQIFRFLVSGILDPIIQSNGRENFDRSAKSVKKVILRKVSPFFHRDAKSLRNYRTFRTNGKRSSCSSPQKGLRSS